jgi:hypothetical protein
MAYICLHQPGGTTHLDAAEKRGDALHPLFRRSRAKALCVTARATCDLPESQILSNSLL